MGLIDRITGIFIKARPETTTTASDTPTPPRNSHDLAAKFRAGGEREEVVRLCRDMYDNDPRAKAIIQTLARDAVKGGFQVEADDKDAVEIADQLIDRLNLKGKIDDWGRLTFRDGDTMLEIGVSAALDIEVVTRKPTLQIHRHSNQFDRFDDPAMAFWMSSKPWETTPSPSSIWFAEWQIIHARWDHDEGRRYGRPLLSASKTAWKRVKEGELDIAVRRKTRAGLRYVHTVEGDETDILDYQERNKETLANPLVALADFFGNKQTSVKVLQGDARLSEIDDVRHHINTFWLSSPVPMAILGYGQDIDFSVIGHQKQQYAETLVEIQSWITDQFIRPLLERQWLLKGKLPETLGYEIKWTPKREVTADEIEKITKAALQMRALGITSEVIAVVIARFIPDIDPDMLFGTGVVGQVDTERLANISNKFLGAMGVTSA